MKTYYFTFGCGSPLTNYYVKIEADDEMSARAMMFCMFSQHWAGVYDKVPQGEELKVQRQASLRLGSVHEPIPDDLYSRAYTSGKVVCHP